jgi:hypothetical protein
VQKPINLNKTMNLPEIPFINLASNGHIQQPASQ